MTMQFALTINMDGAAFSGREAQEVRRILDRLSRTLTFDPSDRRYGANEGALLDLNGNTVGRWAVTNEEDS